MSDDATPPTRTRAEWVTFALALALIGLVVGLIGLSWATGPTGPAVLTAVQSEPITRDGSTYRVPFEVRNEGGEAAESVQVMAELTIAGEVAGEGEQSFMFLSGGEVERGEFFFADDPTTGELVIRVAGYSRP